MFERSICKIGRLKPCPCYGGSTKNWPDPAHTADIALDLASLPFFRADDKTWFRRAGALPANLGTGNYTLTLSATGGGTSASASRQVVLTA